MSERFPIIAVTGSSGAGTSTVRTAFEHIFHREHLRAVMVEGDSFHRFDRLTMEEAIAKAEAEGRHISHYGAEANLFDRLEALFRRYATDGSGEVRRYLHNAAEAEPLDREPGTFTEWEPIAADTDLLFYEGLHGGVVTPEHDVARWVDLLIGVVPVINLEWIQKIQRDTNERGYSSDEVRDAILRRMHDYVHYIVPQFSRTDINFQRVPLVDTSNPFVARDIPQPDESAVVIRFRRPDEQNFPFLLQMLHGSHMSRPNTIVVPGGKLGLAMEIILTPWLRALIKRKRSVGA